MTPDGRYVTDIANDGARFNVMLAALIGCRISLALQAVASMKVGHRLLIRTVVCIVKGS